MHFLSVRGMTPTQMEASFHQIEGFSMCVFVRFILVHSCLNLCGEEVANGFGKLGSQRACFSYGLRVEAQGHALLSHLSQTLPLHLLNTSYISYEQSAHAMPSFRCNCSRVIPFVSG